MSTRTQARNYQCQTIGQDLVSYQCQHGHKFKNYQCPTTGHNLVSYQCQLVTINAKPMAKISSTHLLKRETNNFLTVNKEESIPNNYIWVFYFTS